MMTTTLVLQSQFVYENLPISMSWHTLETPLKRDRHSNGPNSRIRALPLRDRPLPAKHDVLGGLCSDGHAPGGAFVAAEVGRRALLWDARWGDARHEAGSVAGVFDDCASIARQGF